MKIMMLSLWQPWASLCVWTNPKDGKAEKQIETRHWATNYRGLLAIHATKTLTGEGKNSIYGSEMQEAFSRHIPSPDLKEHLPFGCIVGVVELIDCVKFLPRNDERFRGFHFRNWSFGDFTEGRYGWVLGNQIEFKNPIECRGLQGLGSPKPEIRSRISAEILQASCELTNG